MRRFLFILMIFTACKTVQTQSNSTNVNVVNSVTSTNGGEEIGYERFTKSDKQYLGCWRSVKATEVVDFKLEFFRFTEKSVQTSKMSKSVAYKEFDSNAHEDYFVLSIQKSANLQPFLSLNMVDNDEMTFGEYKNQEDILDGEMTEYWNLKRENCDNIKSKFKK
jgi:hypothetical protein